MRVSPAVVAIAATAIIGGCAANSGPPHQQSSPAVSHPVSQPVTQQTSAPAPDSGSTPASTCDRIVAWRQGGGLKPLTHVLHDLGHMRRDANLGDLAAVKADALNLITDANAMQQRPMPGHPVIWHQMTAAFVAAGQAIGQNRIADATVLIRAAGSNATQITDAITSCAG